jgi:Domain of unknown function (DUF4126)
MASALGYTIPFAFASGLNIYATVAVLGLSAHYGLVSLPDQFRALDNPLIIGAALTMYAVEFVADKIPWLDSLWDAVHTIIRPIGGAFVAVAALGHASPAATALAALLGGSVAMTTHLTKAGTRAAANVSPEPFTNWILSATEDLFAVGLTYAAIRHPSAALAVAVVLLVVIAVFSSLLIRFVRRRFRRLPGPTP